MHDQRLPAVLCSSQFSGLVLEPSPVLEVQPPVKPKGAKGARKGPKNAMLFVGKPHGWNLVPNSKTLGTPFGKGKLLRVSVPNKYCNMEIWSKCEDRKQPRLHQPPMIVSSACRHSLFTTILSAGGSFATTWDWFHQFSSTANRSKGTRSAVGRRESHPKKDLRAWICIRWGLQCDKPNAKTTPKYARNGWNTGG